MVVINSSTDMPLKGTLILNKIIISVTIFLLSACSTAKFSVPPYTPSSLTTSALQNLGLDGIEVKSVTSSIDIDNTCPSSTSTIQLPNKSSFEDYIKNALIDEFTIAKVYDSVSPKITLQVDIKELEYFLSHSSLMSVWDIDLKINSSNGNSLRVHEHYLFDAGAYSLWNCQRIADSYMPAIQATISELAHASKFKALITPPKNNLDQ